MNYSSSRFWKAAAILPAAAAAVSASAQQPSFLLHESGEEATGIWSFHHEHVLGTSLEVSVRAGNLVAAERAEAAVLAQIDRDEAGLSTWRADSEVSRWARTRFEPVAVSPELFEVLAAFDGWRERTGGALDASVVRCGLPVIRPERDFGRKRELIYSALRACMGSTEAARRAGTRQATTAAQSSRSATEAKTERSSFPIP
jgi:hypothetical protein